MTGAGTMKYLAVLLILLTSFASGQELSVQSIEFSKPSWGRQIAVISLINNADYHKYVVSNVVVGFTDYEASGRRILSSPSIVEPTIDGAIKMNVPYFVPANYGSGNCRIRLYDVVDTLDNLMSSQIFYDTTIEFSYDIPKEVGALIDSGIHAPMYVDQTVRFDNHFGKLLTLFLKRGKTTAEIAKLCSADESFVTSFASHLTNFGSLSKEDSLFKTNAAIIEYDDFAALKPEIERASEKISQIFEKNIPLFDAELKELADAGQITKDPNDLMSGSSILYHKFPTYFGLALWHNLGTDFVNDGEPFSIFEGSDQINAVMDDYMYLFLGPKDYRGKAFYYYINDEKGERMYVGLFKTPLKRDPYLSAKHKTSIDRDFGEGRLPTFFSYSSAEISGPLDVLTAGVDPVLQELKVKIDERFPDLAESSGIKGARYWCWNIASEMIVDNLIEKGLLSFDDTDVYIFQNLGF